MTFEAGTLVQVKSGGPAMTVTGSSPEGVHCLWYGEATDDIKTAVVPAICLEAVEIDGDEEERGHGH